VGCGGGGEGTSSPAADTGSSTAAPETTLVGALGDSITSGSPGYDPDPAAAAQLGFGQDERSSFEYWAEKAHPGTEFRNCGVYGERTDEIAARLNECADGADRLIVQGGINDIAQSLQAGHAASLTAARTAGKNIAKMLDRAQHLGIPVAVTDVLPWNSGHPAADDAIDLLNREIAKEAGARGIPVLPFHDTLEASSHEEMKPGLTADGDHPSIAGYKLLGEKAYELPVG
jgi:lysophospholipase L1-like esterase